MLADESRSSGAGDFFVFAGVIVRTAALPALDDELATLAGKFAGDEREQLKYSPESNSAQRIWCDKQGIEWSTSWAAVLNVIGSKPRDEIALIAAVHADPRSAGSSVKEAEIHSWGFDALLPRYGRFLEDCLDAGEGPLNEVIADHRADAGLFQRKYRVGWRRGWQFFAHDVEPLGKLHCRSVLLSSMARYAPPLWLADHLAGAIGFWARIERSCDEAEAAGTAGPKTAMVAAARRQISGILGNFRDPLVGGGIAPWPKDLVSNDDVRRWVGRLTAAE
jgi:hypothetical protein